MSAGTTITPEGNTDAPDGRVLGEEIRSRRMRTGLFRTLREL
jgi:hypothetical protein